MKEEKYLTLKQAAEKLHVKMRTIYRYVAEKELRATKIGSWRVEEKDLQDFIDSRSNIGQRKRSK